MKKYLMQIIRFGAVGVPAFIIDYCLLIALTEVFKVDYLISATVAFGVSVVFNYLASMRYVFSHKEELSRRREFILFAVFAVAGLGLNTVMMIAGVELLHIDYRITKLGAALIVAVWNFSTRKIFLDAGFEGEALE